VKRVSYPIVFWTIKSWTDTVLKTDIKMIYVSCMVLVYKIANEKVAKFFEQYNSKLWPVLAGSSQISYEGNNFGLYWVLLGGKMMLQSLNWYSIEDRHKDDRRIMHGACI
jgi:hypothetical protein